MTVRLGKQDLNTEFVYIDLAVDFIQSSFELTPSAGLPSFPDPSMAGVVLMQLKDSLQLKVGVWDALASGGSWGFSGNDTVVVIGELEYKYALHEGQLPGIIALSAAIRIGRRDFRSALWLIKWIRGAVRASGLSRKHRRGQPSRLGIFAAYYPRFEEPPIAPISIGDNFVPDSSTQASFRNAIGMSLARGWLGPSYSRVERIRRPYSSYSTKCSLRPVLAYSPTSSTSPHHQVFTATR